MQFGHLVETSVLSETQEQEQKNTWISCFSCSSVC